MGFRGGFSLLRDVDFSISKPENKDTQQKDQQKDHEVHGASLLFGLGFHRLLPENIMFIGHQASGLVVTD